MYSIWFLDSKLLELDTLFKIKFILLSDILPTVAILSFSLFIKLLHINKGTKSFRLLERIFRLCSRCSIRSHTVAMTTSPVFTQATKKETDDEDDENQVPKMFLVVRQQTDVPELQFLKPHSNHLFLSSNTP